MMLKLLRVFLPVFLLMPAAPSSAHASGRDARLFLDQLTPLDQTNAFAQYRTRPENELSKMIYLVDRFSEMPLEIIYDGKTFNTRMVARIVRWFIKNNYKNETAHDWINKWCYRTIPSGVLIWTRGPDKNFYPARDILFEELEELELRMAELCSGMTMDSDLQKVDVSVVQPETAPTREMTLPLPQMLAVATQN